MCNPNGQDITNHPVVWATQKLETRRRLKGKQQGLLPSKHTEEPELLADIRDSLGLNDCSHATPPCLEDTDNTVFCLSTALTKETRSSPISVTASNQKLRLGCICNL